MLLNSTESLRVAVMTDLVRASRAGVLGRPLSSALPSDQSGLALRLADAERALKDLLMNPAPDTGRTWRSVLHRRDRLDVFIDNAWVRLFPAEWHSALRTFRDFEAYLSVEFNRRFGLEPSGWTLEYDLLKPGERGLVCAYPTDAVKQLKSLAAETRLRLNTIMPLFLGEVARMSHPARSESWIHVGSGGSYRPVVLMKGRRVVDFLRLPARALNAGRLVQAFQERSGAALAEDCPVLSSQGDAADLVKALLMGAAMSNRGPGNMRLNPAESLS